MATVVEQSDTRSLGRIFSETVDRVIARTDNVYGSRATLNALMQAPGVREGHRGGQRVQVPLILTDPEKAGPVQPFGTFDISPSRTRTAALYTVQRYIAPITIDNAEAQYASNPEGVGDLLGAETEEARLSLETDVNRDLSDDGTVAGTLVGLEAILPEDVTTGTLGGVSRVTNTNYRPPASVQNTSLATLLAAMDQAFTNAQSGGNTPNLILGHRVPVRMYRSQLQATLEMSPSVIKEQRGADGRTNNLMFGAAEVVMDENFQDWTTGTGDVFAFLNTKYLRFAIAAGQEFVPLTWTRPANQDVMVGGLRWMGAFYCTQPRRQALVYDIRTS